MFGARTFNYWLFGKDHRNHVISYEESTGFPHDDVPEQAPPRGTLHSSLIQQMGITHLFTMGTPNLIFDGCISIRKADELEAGAGPQKLSLPRILYALKECDERGGVR